jgi:hypothetical protein
MWRVVLIVIAVVVLDVILLFVGAPDLDWNMREISNALRARDENPSLEAQRALVAALDKGARMSGNSRFGFGVTVVAVTNIGLFIAGFVAGRRPRRVGRSEAGYNATRNI